MCGIVGYIGKEQAQPILLDGLKRLEYRGYDSAGIAVLEDGHVAFNKRPGKIEALSDALEKRRIEGTIGLSHTRWATHGVPNEANAHPHLDCRQKIALVHNGIVENYESLRRQLRKEGHRFRSETDTETIVHLVEKYYRGSLEQAVRRAIREIRGTYALGVVSSDEPDKIVAVRSGSPLVIGLGRGENFLASDVPALLGFTRRVIYPKDGEVIVLSRQGVEVSDGRGRRLRNPVVRVSWDISASEKGGFPHFMLKEIHEQPRAIGDTLLGRLSEDRSSVVLSKLGLTRKALAAKKEIFILGCGTAWHAGLVGKYMLEELAGIPVEVDISSEFRYRRALLGKETLVIAVSQSGETADTLAGVKEARRRGATVLAICNAMGSSLTREADGVIYTCAGPEIAVASTKAYTSQLTVFALLTIFLARLRGTIDKGQARQMIAELEKIPRQIQRILMNKAVIQEAARRIHRLDHFLVLGRGYNYPTALEGALKLKEISYIASEGFAAGEMKHGPIALVNENLAVIGIATRSAVYDKMISNLQEVKARRGLVLAIATEGDREIKRHADRVFYVPPAYEPFSPFLNVVPLQLLAYYVAAQRGCDIDQPRNLAKSVTVE